MNYEYHLLVALVLQGDMSSYVRLKLSDDLFLKASTEAQSLLAYLSNHIEAYGTLPSPQTLESLGYNLASSPEPWNFYWDKVRDLHSRHLVVDVSRKCHAEALAGWSDGILSLLEKAMAELVSMRTHDSIIEITEDALPLYAQHLKNLSESAAKAIHTGWPHLDKMNGGFLPGDFISIIGRPGLGKSWACLHIAANAFKEGKQVLFVSMEMPILEIVTRIVALLFKLNPTSLENWHLTKADKDKILGGMSALKESGGKVWVLDGNLKSTPDEIYALASQHRPDLVVIDGAYLLSSRNPRLDRFSRVAENVESCKRHTHIHKIPTLASFQFNRGAKSKKDSSEVGLEDIGYTDAIGQVSSLVLGMFEGPSADMYTRRIQVLKGRKGEVGGFSIHWNFSNMDFSEVRELSPVDDGDDYGMYN
jgi:replicative DNA helicase